MARYKKKGKGKRKGRKVFKAVKIVPPIKKEPIEDKDDIKSHLNSTDHSNISNEISNTKCKDKSNDISYNKSNEISNNLINDSKDTIKPQLHGHGYNGENSNNKKKIAPRSSSQFKIGPKFLDTIVFRKVFITSNEEQVIPILDARVDRGFELIDNEWIGYKRNYFTLVSAFQFLNHDENILFNEKFHVLGHNDEKLNIKCFALRLVSTCCEEDVVVNLVQHTAKRDRGPQYLPPVYPSIPGELPDHDIIKQSANIRNGGKIDSFNKLFFTTLAGMDIPAKENSIIQTYPHEKLTKVARYERMQFSTTINYRKPALIKRHFVLKVELLGVLDDGRYTVLASIESPPLIVRGRSPSNYHLTKALKKQKAISKQDNHIEQRKEKIIPACNKVTKFKEKSIDTSNKSAIESSPFKIKSVSQFNKSIIDKVNKALNLADKFENIYQDEREDIPSLISRQTDTNIFTDSTSVVGDYHTTNDIVFDPILDTNIIQSSPNNKLNTHQNANHSKHRHKHKDNYNHNHRHGHSHKHNHKHKHKHRHKSKVKSESNNESFRPSSPVERENDEIDSSFNKFQQEMQELQKRL